MFKGKLHAPKANLTKTRSLTYFARKIPELVDKRIAGQFTGDPKTLVKNIIDNEFSSVISYTAFDTNAPSDQTIEITYNNYGFQVLRDIFIKSGWDGYFDNDSNDDGKTSDC